MAMYERGDSDGPAVVDRWEGGVGWLAHPGEDGERASHAFRTADGVWVVDPLDAPGVDDLLADLGDVAGVAVLSNYHARDADELARRHGVPVHVPAWSAMDRVVDRLDAAVERFEEGFAGFEGGVGGFGVRRVDPLPGWTEAVAYRERDGTLYVPDVLSASGKFAVADERVGLFLLSRLRPPGDAFGDVTPERILFGHGDGVFADAEGALENCLDGARRRFPRALATTAGTQLRALFDAVRN
ncbi:MAG: hypothetical protein ABEJ90_00805 [Halobacterium sp.]